MARIGLTRPDPRVPMTSAITPRAAWGPSASRVCAAVARLSLAGVYAPVLSGLARTWWEQPDYSHGFFVIPIALAVFWRLRPSAGPAVGPSRWGWLLLAATLAARTACHELGETSMERATLPASAAAAVVAFGGFGLLGATWPAVAFLVFMLPVPAAVDARLALPLQRLAATASGEVLRASGLWVVNEGNVLVLGDDRLEVATACNGLAMLMSLSATVTALIFLLPMPRWKRACLLAGLFPIALTCNILRIVATAWCYTRFEGESVRGLAHDAAGWMMMPLALALVGLELRWLSWVRPDPDPDAIPPGRVEPGTPADTGGGNPPRPRRPPWTRPPGASRP